MESNEFKLEKKIQSKSNIGKQIQKENEINEIKNKAQSKKEEDNYISENNMDYEDQMKDNRDTTKKLEEFIYSSNHDQENNEKKESCKKSTQAKDKVKDNKEKGEMKSDANENSFIDGQKIESFPLIIKKKKIERKKSKKKKQKNSKKEFKKVKENNSQKDIKKKEEKKFEIKKEKKWKIEEKRKNIFEIKKEINCRKEIDKKKIFKTQKIKTGQKRVKKKKKFETFISSSFYEEMELNEISEVFVNKINQKYENINIKPVYLKLFNFKFPIFDSLFIPQIDNDEEKLNLDDVINVSSNHSRYNMTLNFANEERTNSYFSYHPLFIYSYSTTNYSSNI